MLKEKLKGFVVGVVLTSLVVGAIPTMAEKVTKSAELLYNNIKVVIDGKQADLKDAQGNTVEPFIIDGTTYLPVRAVSNALNKAVSWDGATQTVYIGKNNEINQPSVWLTDLKTFTGEVSNVVNTSGIYGNNLDVANDESQYERYVYLGSGDHYNRYPTELSASYLLNANYKKFKTTLYLPESFKNGTGKANVYIYLDEKLVYSSPDIKSGTLPINIDIDTTNAVKMEIKCISDLYHADGAFYPSTIPFGNPGLYE